MLDTYENKVQGYHYAYASNVSAPQAIQTFNGYFQKDSCVYEVLFFRFPLLVFSDVIFKGLILNSSLLVW